MRTLARIAAAAAMLLAAAMPSLALEAQPVFADPQDEQLYLQLVNQLRCPVCQNQTIADSDAPLASDLRASVEQLVRDGRGKDEILAFVTERYGDFVRYQPPFKPSTAALWLAPAILLLLGGTIIYYIVRSQAGLAGQGDADDEEPDIDESGRP